MGSPGSQMPKELFCRTIRVPECWFHMEYRGKHYSIVQGAGTGSWQWKVQLDDKTVKSGEAGSREAAKNMAIWVIDEALTSRPQN